MSWRAWLVVLSVAIWRMAYCDDGAGVRCAYLCQYGFMRTTVEIPDALFRRTKAAAALRGSSLKDLIVQAIEKEVSSPGPGRTQRVQLPLVRAGKGKKLKLDGFNFDDLLA